MRSARAIGTARCAPSNSRRCLFQRRQGCFRSGFPKPPHMSIYTASNETGKQDRNQEKTRLLPSRLNWLRADALPVPPSALIGRNPRDKKTGRPVSSGWPECGYSGCARLPSGARHHGAVSPGNQPIHSPRNRAFGPADGIARHDRFITRRTLLSKLLYRQFNVYLLQLWVCSRQR
jgi:hypothetical protein